MVGAARSGAYLLFVFLGGATFFFGPIIGAVLMVIALVLLSELTKAWLLYLGLVFLFMVMYAPGGIASLIMMNLRVAAFGKLRTLWTAYLALGGTAFVVLVGAAAMIEMLYHLQLNHRARAGAAVPGRHARTPSSARQLVRRGLRGWSPALALFELARRSFKRRVGRDPGRDREGDQARGRAL